MKTLLWDLLVHIKGDRPLADGLGPRGHPHGSGSPAQPGVQAEQPAGPQVHERQRGREHTAETRGERAMNAVFIDTTRVTSCTRYKILDSRCSGGGVGRQRTPSASADPPNKTKQENQEQTSNPTEQKKDPLEVPDNRTTELNYRRKRRLLPVGTHPEWGQASGRV